MAEGPVLKAKMTDQAPASSERIERLVAGFIEAVGGTNGDRGRFDRAVREIATLGQREILATSQMSRRLLDEPGRVISDAFDGKSEVGRNLAELRRAIQELDPARLNLSRPRRRKLLGVIPMRDRLRAYFDRYAAAQDRIHQILTELAEGRAELEQARAALGQERRSLWTQMETLRQYALLAERLDEEIGRLADAVEATDQSRARLLRADAQFAVRRRRQDILTQLAVATQSEAALAIVDSNNQELVRAIETATTTTVGALRTGVMVAKALASQRRAVDQLKLANDVAEAAMVAAAVSGERPATDGRAGTSDRANLAALRRAWGEVFATLDEIDSHRLTALQAVATTVRELSDQATRLEPGDRDLGDGGYSRKLVKGDPDGSQVHLD